MNTGIDTLACLIEPGGECEEVETAEDPELDLQSLPIDALQIILAKLDRTQVTSISRECRSLREAGLAILRGSLRRLLDRSACELSKLRQQALVMRGQSQAGRQYGSLALNITTARLVRMELRVLAAASWRHLCAPFGPKLALPGTLLDEIEAVLDSVASGELTSAAQPEATAGLFLRCEKFLDFFSDVLEPPLALSSFEWAPLGSRLADALAATSTRRVHKEAISRASQGLRLTATYRLPGLVEPPPPSLPNLKSGKDSAEFAEAAHRILCYVRRSVHMHNLILVMKDQWSMEDVLERRGSAKLLSGFIFDQHDQPGDFRLITQSNERSARSLPTPRLPPPQSQTKWDGLLCELQMIVPSAHLLPPHLQLLTNQIWPQSSSTDAFKSVSSPSVKMASSSNLSSLAEKTGLSRASSKTPALNLKSTRMTHSLMTVNGTRADTDNLRKSMSFDNVDAVREVLRRISCHDSIDKSMSTPATSTLGGSNAKEIRSVDLTVVENSCVCFSLTDTQDVYDDIVKIEISDNLNDKSNQKPETELSPDVGTHQDTFPGDDTYYFRLHITARYPETNRHKSGLREATIIVVDSEEGSSAWLADDRPLC